MTRQQFRRQLAALGFSQLECARRLEVDPRTVRRWALGEKPVPQPIALLLECWRQAQTASQATARTAKPRRRA